MGQRKFVQTVLVTWLRWPPCPYMVKTLKNLLLRKQNADDLEIWYAASGAWVPSLFKWWHWVDHDLFYGKVKFGPLCFFLWEKVKTMDFSETIVVYDLKLATDDQSDTKSFCWHQNFVPWGLAPGLYTCIKSWIFLYKIRFQRDFFETCNKWVKW